jgi:hypothetical protein
MAGNANQKILPLATRFRKPLRFLNRQTLLTEMHTTGTLRKRHIQPIINQNAGWSCVARGRFCGPLQSFTREQTAVSSRTIFLPNLNPIDTRSCCGFDFQQESFLCVPSLESHKAVLVRHIAEEQARR